MTPALLMSTFRSGCSVISCFATRSMLSGSAISSSSAAMPGLAATTASRCLRRRPAIITLLPSPWSASASARPMPDPPPVMKMVLPVSFMMVSCMRSDEAGSVGESVAEHRQAADGLVLGRLVLKHIPVLGKLAVLHADDVRGDPGRWATVPGEAPMRDHIVAFSEHNMVLVFQAIGQRAYQVEQTVTSGRDMSTVLDISIGPEALGGGVVALVEERVEGFENERFVLHGGGLGHLGSPGWLEVKRFPPEEPDNRSSPWVRNRRRSSSRSRRAALRF